MDIFFVVYFVTVFFMCISAYFTRKDIKTWGNVFVVLCLIFIPLVNTAALLYILIAELKDKPTPWTK